MNSLPLRYLSWQPPPWPRSAAQVPTPGATTSRTVAGVWAMVVDFVTPSPRTFGATATQANPLSARIAALAEVIHRTPVLVTAIIRSREKDAEKQRAEMRTREQELKAQLADREARIRDLRRVYEQTEKGRPGPV